MSQTVRLLAVKLCDCQNILMLVNLKIDSFFILVEPDWIVEFAKKKELVEKANKLKVVMFSCCSEHVSAMLW